MQRMKSHERAAASGRRERRKTATRLELIEAGRRLFGEKGLYESRIEDLTAHAGIAKGTLYTYFAHKDELVRAVASAGFGELEAHVARAVHGARGEPDVLRRAIRAHIVFYAANPELMRVFHQVRGMLKFDRAAWRPLRATVNTYVDALARILASAPRIGALPRPARRELAGLVFGSVSGATSVRAALGRAPHRGRAARPLVESLVAMARAYVDLATPRRTRG